MTQYSWPAALPRAVRYGSTVPIAPNDLRLRSAFGGVASLWLCLICRRRAVLHRSAAEPQARLCSVKYGSHETILATLLLVVFCLLLPLVFSAVLAQEPKRSLTKPRRKVSSEIENPAGLGGFFQALSTIKTGRRRQPVRVMHFGDSHTAVDILTAEIRRRLQTRFGDGGPGLIVPGNPMSTRRRGVSSGATAGWTIEGIGGRIPADRILGPAGIGLATSAANEHVWLETAANHFEIYYVRQPGGGRIQVSVDGVSVVPRPLSLSSTTTRFDAFVYDTSTDQNHRIEIQTVGTGRVRLLGIVAEHQSGVTYDQLINGARAARMLG